MSVAEFRPLIDKAATRNGLDPLVIVAQVQVESDGNPMAWNPEPRYQWLWDLRLRRPFRRLDPSEIERETPPPDFRCYAGDPDQEWWAQQASWGLLQVMGAVARELGCSDDYLTVLIYKPEEGLDFGCRALAAQLRATNGDLRSALARYNGGPKGNAPGGPLRNESYVVKVETQMKALA